MTRATLVNNVVRDMLTQNQFKLAHYPELVDLAVVATGLGLLQSNIGFVNNKGSFWDSTRWEVPRPFLDGQALAYTSAIASWIRNEPAPGWANDLPSEVKRPMQKSLKYLTKSNDSFFQSTKGGKSILDQAQPEWWAMANQGPTTQQVVALRHLNLEGSLTTEQESLLVEKLRSTNEATLLNAIAASERLTSQSVPMTDELRHLVEHRDNEVRSKAMFALTRLGELDEATINVAAKMLDGPVKFVVYAGIFALSSLDGVPEQVLQSANRGFSRALQSCDYEFVGLYTAAYNRWLTDPEAHFQELLEHDSPDYLEIALDSLANVREQLVTLKQPA